MAKLAFSKLGLKLDNNIEQIDFNNQIVEVKKYLPIQDKLDIIGNAINLEKEYNNNSFLNIPLLIMLIDLEIVYAYTNLSFTEKQKEDITKLYDLMESNGFINLLKENIQEEYSYILNHTIECAKLSYDYNNSAYGLLDSLQNNYDNLNLDANSIQQKLADPENMDLLRQVLAKLG